MGADGRIYVAGREGTTAVVQRGPVFKLLATNTLDDGFDASPVAVDSELYLRGSEVPLPHQRVVPSNHHTAMSRMGDPRDRRER